MLCEKCGKKPATVMYTQIVNGQKSALNICSECASKESIFDNLGSLLNFGTREGVRAAACPVCGMTISELSRKGRMGCGECYKTFRTQAGAMLKKIHGTTKHISGESKLSEKEKAPQKPKDKLTELREKLQKAIEAENFEEAAVLRDEIRSAENK